MSGLSSRDEKILQSEIEKSSGYWIMVDREKFKSASPKKMAFSCYCKGLTFHWSHKHYYIGNIKEQP